MKSQRKSSMLRPLWNSWERLRAKVSNHSFRYNISDEGDNIDLDSWTLAELAEVVEKFKQQLNKNKRDLLSSRTSRDFKRAKIFFTAKKDKVKYEGTSLWDYEQKYEQECAISQIIFQIPHNITPKVQVQNYQIRAVGGFIFGIWARNQLEITIGTNFTSEKVTRKDEDCDWLRNILVSKYAGSYVPPLQPSRQFQKDNKKGIAARIESITTFLNTLMKYPVFHYSADFKQFLTQTDYKDFSDHKITESAIAIQKDLLQIDTPKGSFTVEVSDELNTRIKESSRLAEQFNSLYNELSNGINKVITDLSSVSESFRFLTNVTMHLGEKYTEIQSVLKHEDVIFDQIRLKLPAIMLSINQSASIIQTSLNSHITALQELIDSFMKPAVRDWNEFTHFTHRHQNEIKNYLTNKENLLKKKQKYLMDPTKWELSEAQFIKIQRLGPNKLSRQESFEKMFPLQNDKQNRSKIWLSFVNQSYLQSFRRFLSQHEKSLLQTYLTYTSSQMNSGMQVRHSYQGFREMIGS